MAVVRLAGRPDRRERRGGLRQGRTRDRVAGVPEHPCLSAYPRSPALRQRLQPADPAVLGDRHPGVRVEEDGRRPDPGPPQSNGVGRRQVHGDAGAGAPAARAHILMQVEHPIQQRSRGSLTVDAGGREQMGLVATPRADEQPDWLQSRQAEPPQQLVPAVVRRGLGADLRDGNGGRAAVHVRRHGADGARAVARAVAQPRAGRVELVAGQSIPGRRVETAELARGPHRGYGRCGSGAPLR
jgi:hypothetical protein